MFCHDLLVLFLRSQSRFGRFPGQCQSFKNFESQKNFARLAPQGSDRKLRAKRFVANFRSNKLEIDEQGFVKFVFKWLGKFKFSHQLVDIVWKMSHPGNGTQLLWNTYFETTFWISLILVRIKAVNHLNHVNHVSYVNRVNYVTKSDHPRLWSREDLFHSITNVAT